MLPKLLFRTLPEYYPPQSAYSHFPFMVPELMEGYLAKLSDKPRWNYTFDKPKRSKPLVVNTIPQIMDILKDNEHFESIHVTKLEQILQGDLADRALVRYSGSVQACASCTDTGSGPACCFQRESDTAMDQIIPENCRISDQGEEHRP